MRDAPYCLQLQDPKEGDYKNAYARKEGKSEHVGPQALRVERGQSHWGHGPAGGLEPSDYGKTMAVGGLRMVIFRRLFQKRVVLWVGDEHEGRGSSFIACPDGKKLYES